MFYKFMAYVLHSLIIVIGAVATVLYPKFFILIIPIGYLITIHLKEHCLGLYYNDRENISVEIIEVGPKTVKR